VFAMLLIFLSLFVLVIVVIGLRYDGGIVSYVVKEIQIVPTSLWSLGLSENKIPQHALIGPHTEYG